jgi:hypothetical protein
MIFSATCTNIPSAKEVGPMRDIERSTICIPDMFAILVKREEVGAIRQKILSRVERIAPEMGTSFVSATKLCIGQDFGIHEDDKAQSRLSRMFEHEVLRKLDAGTKVDD